MNTPKHKALLVLVVLASVAVVGLPAPAAASAVVTIKVLSNRADLVSGGDALVEVVLPSGTNPADVRVYDDSRDVTSAFAVRPDGRFLGLVTGLSEGPNIVKARVPGGRGARIAVTNHPVSGPVFSGPQTVPFRCATEKEGLGPSEPPLCQAPTKIGYWYLPSVNASALEVVDATKNRGFLRYDPTSPPPDLAIARTTTDQGKTVPFVVRVEKGVINRSIYWIAVLADPAETINPLTPPSAWNGKLLYHFNGGANPGHSQARPEIAAPGPAWGMPLDREVLGRGFAKAMATLNHFGTSTNDVVSAETMMMVKERVIESLGPVRYTIGNGCSGGSIQQHLITGPYPGLLDGIMPMCSFPDLISTASDIMDCQALARYFQSNPERTPVQQAAIYGQQTGSECLAWLEIYSLHKVAFDPTFGCFPNTFRSDAPSLGQGVEPPALTQDVPNVLEMVGRGDEPEDLYDPESNLDGVRCTYHDDMVNVFGTRDSDGFANRPYDNVGVQYGLKALIRGVITPDQFINLNQHVGGYDIDNRWQPERTKADFEGLANAYRTGRIADGIGQGEVPIIDYRGTANSDIHADSRSYMMRARLQRANGRADNQIIWNSDVALLGSPAMNAEALAMMDRWVAAIEADTSSASPAEKVVRNKPADAEDGCWVAGRRVSDRNACNAAFPLYEQPRIVAGGPMSNDILKCQLKPLDRRGYGSVQFSDAQWVQLRQIFPGGVCDWTKPGVGQQEVVPWLSFDVPGGKPLGAPPRSVPVS